MTTIYPRKTEMTATCVPIVPPAASAFRVSADGAFLQVKDHITNMWRSFWLENGVRVYGPEVN